MPEFRTDRIGALIQEKISALILEGRVKDPRVNPFLSIMRVEVSRDLSYADVFVSNIKEGTNIERGTEGLNSASGFIQSRLFLKLRKTPRLRFHADTSIRDSFDLVKKIESLSVPEREPAGEGEGEKEAQAGESQNTADPE